MRGYRRLLNISYKAHVSNEEIRRQIQIAFGEYDELLTMIKKRKLRWFGPVSMSSGLPKTNLQGTVNGRRRREVDRRSDGKTSSTMAAEDRTRCKGVVRSHLWCPPTALQGYGIDLTRLD